MLCALVCKDFSHGQPDVLHLSCVVEKLFTLGGKEEARRRQGGGRETLEMEGRERETKK